MPVRDYFPGVKTVTGVTAGDFNYIWAGKKQEPFVVKEEAWAKRHELEKQPVVWENIQDRNFSLNQG